MKAQSITQKLSWLHTWGGLIFGWILFAIFLTGTLAVFDKEISYWMQPELQKYPLSQVEAAQRGLDWLSLHHADAPHWSIGLPTERSPGLRVSASENRRGPSQMLDARTGEALEVRDSAGGSFFFGFHFTLNLPRMLGVWTVGLAAMAMLAALVSGIVIHKKFFKELFTFRPAKGQRSWLDAHNASAVLVLPFHLMITYTGLVIFYLIYMPAAVDALYDGDRQALQGDLRPVASQQQGPQGSRERRAGGVEARDAVAPMQPLARFIEAGERHFGVGGVASLSISHPGKEGSTVSVGRLLGSRMALTKGDSLSMDAYSGEVLQAPAESRPSLLTQRVMAGLHFAQFGGYPMRWLYFLCGLASCAMIATGLVLFSVKRRRKYAAEGIVGRALYHAVEALNVTAIAGLGVACVAYIGSSRLLPVALEGRAGLEVTVFFGVWLATLVHALVRPRQAAWREQLALAAALCLLLPLLDGLSAVHSPLAGLSIGDGMRFWMDGVAFGIGLALAWTAWKVSRPAAEPVRRKQRRPEVVEAV